MSTPSRAGTASSEDATATAQPTTAVREVVAVAGASRPRVAAHRPATQVMLGRLRTQLACIEPAPCSAAEAHEQIAQAMARAQLGGWSLPPLEGDATESHPDGSRTITLVAHAVVINASGAFRIVDCLRPASPYFELRGADGRPFAMPSVFLFSNRGCGRK